MVFRILADAVVVLHLAVVAYIVLGGLLAWRWPQLALVHLPFAAWGVAIEVGRWVCPLTPLEVWLRRRGGEAGYQGGFVEHYLIPILYPVIGSWGALSLAGLVLVVNVLIYLPVLRKKRAARGRARERTTTSV